MSKRTPKMWSIEVQGTTGEFFRPEVIEHNSRTVANRFWHQEDAINTARDRYLMHEGIAVRIVRCD